MHATGWPTEKMKVKYLRLTSFEKEVQKFEVSVDIIIFLRRLYSIYTTHCIDDLQSRDKFTAPFVNDNILPPPSAEYQSADELFQNAQAFANSQGYVLVSIELIRISIVN